MARPTPWRRAGEEGPRGSGILGGRKRLGDKTSQTRVKNVLTPSKTGRTIPYARAQRRIAGVKWGEREEDSCSASRQSKLTTKGAIPQGMIRT